MKKIILFIILIQFTSITYARMYQWNDPDTGTTQLSGKPPAWYRSVDGGPRVFVFENGRLVDDTGINLSEQESDRLRQLALLRAEQDRQAAIAKLQQASQQRAILELQSRDTTEVETAIQVPVRDAPVIEQRAPEQPAGPSAEELRALIEQYEQLRTQDARQLVETVAPGENAGQAPR